MSDRYSSRSKVNLSETLMEFQNKSLGFQIFSEVNEFQSNDSVQFSLFT